MSPPVERNASQLASRIFEFIDEILLRFIVQITDKGNIILDDEFTMLDMLEILCPACRARNSDTDTDIVEDVRDTSSDCQTVGKNVTTNAKKATSSKKQPTPAEGARKMQTRLTNKLSPEMKMVYYAAVNHLKGESKLRHLLEDEIMDLIDSVTVVRELRQSEPNLSKIKTVRLSRVTKEDLEEMGVKAVSAAGGVIALNEQHLKELLNRSEHVSLEGFEIRWTTMESFLLCTNLRTTLVYFGRQFEPRSRAVIDDFNKSLVRIVTETSPEDAGPAVLFEVTLGTRDESKSSASSNTTARKNSKESAVADLVVFQNVGTHLTGRGDYLSVIASYLGEADLAELREASSIGDVQKMIDKARAGDDTPEFLLCIIETKRLLATIAELMKHSPQVVAQSVAVMQKTKRTSVPWCLTDGHNWIFGLTWKLEGQQGYSYDTVTVDALTDIAVLETCSKQILQAKIGWATVKSDELKELMTAWREAKETGERSQQT